MNTSIKKRIAATLASATLAMPTYASIEIDAVIANLGLGGEGNKTIITGFDPGSSDKMVIFLGGEHGFPLNTGGQFNSVTLNGFALNPIIQEESGIPTIAAFYLDDPGLTAGAGDLIVNQGNHNQSIYSIYLLSGTAEGVGNSATSTGAGNNSINLTTTAPNSLILIGHENAGPGGGNGAGNYSANTPLIEDTNYLVVGSNWTSLSTAHAFVTTPGSATYSYSGDDPSDLIAMAAVEILQGPPPPAITLRVNTITGEMTFVGDPDDTVTINYYEIASAGSSLNPTGWNSLADQDYEGNGPANGSGNGWEQAGGSNARALAEAYLLGDSAFTALSETSLGTAYNTTVDAQDLIFTYRTDVGKIRNGIVEYIATLDGDLNGDLVVNQLDLDIVLSNFGSGVQPGSLGDGDATGDGLVDAADLNYVLRRFGGVPPTGTDVPEPAGWALVGLGLALLTRRGRRDC